MKLGPFLVTSPTSQRADIKAWFEEVSSKFESPLVRTHYRDARHQAHRVPGEFVRNTFRNHLVRDAATLPEKRSPIGPSAPPRSGDW